MSMKNPLTPSGIEPATFRFVAQQKGKKAIRKLERGGKIWLLARVARKKQRKKSEGVCGEGVCLYSM